MITLVTILFFYAHITKKAVPPKRDGHEAVLFMLLRWRQLGSLPLRLLQNLLLPELHLQE